MFETGCVTYTLRRIAGLVPTLFVLVTLSFFIIRLAPGGPFDQEQALPPAIRANLDAAYGLDQPLLVQYGRYLAGVVQGDLGPSLRYKDFPVTELIARGLPLSLTIGLAAALLAFFIGVPLGALCGVARRLRGRSRAHELLDAGRGVAGVRGRAAAGAGVRHLLADLPRRAATSRAMSSFLVLPVITLALPVSAYVARLMRNSMRGSAAREFHSHRARQGSCRARCVPAARAASGADSRRQLPRVPPWRS